MNVRIKQLAEQAGINIDSFQFSGTPIKYIVGESSLEKLAELIVRECIDIGDNYQDILGNEPECFNCRKVAYGIGDKIKQHFGVEE